MCESLQAGGHVALSPLGVPQVEGLQRHHGRQLAAQRHRSGSAREGRKRSQNPGSLEGLDSPQLGVHQRVVVQHQRLQVNQAPHLGRQAVQLVVAQVQIQQVRQVDEQLVGDGIDAVVAQVQHQHVAAVLQVPGDLCQLVVAQVLKAEAGGAKA